MYKLLILISLIFFTTHSFAQKTVIGTPNNLTVVRGAFGADTALYIPERDTALCAVCPSANSWLVRRPQDKKVYYYNGTRWLEVMSNSSATLQQAVTNGKNVTTDSAKFGLTGATDNRFSLTGAGLKYIENKTVFGYTYQRLRTTDFGVADGDGLFVGQDYIWGVRAFAGANNVFGAKKGNYVYSWGYNTSPEGARISTADAGWRMGHENHYYIDDGINPFFEFFFPEVTTLSGHTYRPWAVYANKTKPSKSFIYANMPKMTLAEGTGSHQYFVTLYDSTTNTADLQIQNVNDGMRFNIVGSSPGVATIAPLRSSTKLLFSGWTEAQLPITTKARTFTPIVAGDSINVAGHEFFFGGNIYRHRQGVNAYQQLASTGEYRMWVNSGFFQTLYGNGAEVMRISSTGKVLIKTTTSSTFDLDVNGTARVSGELAIEAANPYIRLTATTPSNNDPILNYSAGLLKLCMYGASARGLYIDVTTGRGCMTATTSPVSSNIGFGFYTGITATSGSAKAVLIGATVTAAANNDVMHGLEVSSPFVNGAFTGVTNAGVSVTTAFTNSSGTATYQGVRVQPTYNNTGTYSGTVRGIFYDPVNTSLTGTTHIGIENTSGSNYLNSVSGNTGIGVAGGGTLSDKVTVSGNVLATKLKMNTPVAGASTDLVVLHNSTDKELKTTVSLATIAAYSNSATFSPDGVATDFVVTHSLGFTPSQVFIQPTSLDATTFDYFISNKGATTFTVSYTAAPLAGSNNLTFDWAAKR